MAIRRQPPQRRKKVQADIPFDEDIFTAAAHEQQDNDIFVSLAGFSSEPLQDELGIPPEPMLRSQPFRYLGNRFSAMQVGLLAGIIFVAAALAYAFVGRLAPSQPAAPPASPGLPLEQYVPPQAAIATMPTVTPPVSTPPAPAQSAEIGLPNPEPLSLQIADKLYLAGDFESALATYERLFQRLPPTEAQQPLRDFLLLRMALCSKNTGDIARSDTMFRTVSLSRLPMLRALARYHQSTTLMERQRYLEAVTKAYQTIALIEVVDYDKPWAQTVQRQCNFLVAEALTRHLLSLRDADTDVPRQLWGRHPDVDPFVNLDEPQLKVFLASGAEKLDEALLSPQIRATAEEGRWSVICNGAPVEELLSRFATNAGLNLHWVESGQAALDEETVRKRPVYLYLASATAQQAMAIAAGSVGLLARMDETGNVKVTDPSFYTSLADHANLLTDESISLWQRFLLTAVNDKRIPNSHFALGLLHVARGRLDDAIAEYKLMANRFPQDPLAPAALLHSGKLKVTLRDYVGAKDDLRQLVELYPDSELTDRACLYLADTTMKAGSYAEAAGLYRKVHDLGLSIETQTESAFGAGRCLYETQDYEQAAKWLNRYVTLARDQNRREFQMACLLLGKTYVALEKPEQAHAALKLALKGELSHQQHVETAAMLVRTYIQQGLYIEGLNVLEGTQAWQLSQQEMIELLLLRAQILRAMGLVDKAVALLGEKSQFLPNPELKGRVALELAACYGDMQQYEDARQILSEAFALVQPGPLAQQIGCELAGVCLHVGQAGQAISVCSQLLEHTTDATEIEQITTRLAAAYRAQSQYDRAISALAASPAGGPAAAESLQTPQTTGQQ
ncbi:MAG: tetratricopeptide repeat protein [Sedimentisphaerales bacterium]|nr:tetratricopeptide repeat protein [Sedimentisphaerales bacterium]